MIYIKDKKDCTGCGACVNACPVGAIAMKEDEDGFRYPSVNFAQCINCAKCDRACVMRAEKLPMPAENQSFVCEFYAGQLFDKQKLFEVSSGGAFLAFTEAVLAMGGIVYGVEQVGVDQVQHVRISDQADAARIRRSKYLQSDVGNCYNLVRKDLADGKKVLFSGTGCQIAALNKFLEKEYANLFTCDVVCHGVPSMLAWRMFRKELEDSKGAKIEKLVFRDKSAGWSNNQYSIVYSDGTFEKIRSTEHIFHAGYLQGLFYRPSCGSCRFANLPRVSDITLADYWKYEGKFHSKQNDVGVSLIVVNNSKGKQLLDCAGRYMDIESTGREEAMESCKHLDEKPTENIHREAFFEELHKNGYFSAARKYVVIPCNKMNFAHRVIRKIKMTVKKHV